MYSDNSVYNSIIDGVTESKLRIAIIMINSPKISNYAHMATISNYLYATKHSYDFIVERQPTSIKENWEWDYKNEYVIVWSKASIIKKHLKNYHYVLFIDSDAFFNNYDHKIEDILVNECNDERVIIFQEDIWTKKTALELNLMTDKICTGLIFVKNCQYSFDILDKWIRAPYENDCETFRYNHPREQGCIMYLREKYPEIRKNIYVYPAKAGLFGQYDSDWITHLGGTDKNTRLQMISNHCITKFNLFRQETYEELISLTKKDDD